MVVVITMVMKEGGENGVVVMNFLRMVIFGAVVMTDYVVLNCGGVDMVLYG